MVGVIDMSGNEIIRARSTDEYVRLIEQAIDETFDLRQSIEYDEEYMSDARAFVDDLEAILKDLYQSMKDEKYEFATGDLAFMSLMERYHDAVLPYKFLLKRINETHMKGLEIK